MSMQIFRRRFPFDPPEVALQNWITACSVAFASLKFKTVHQITSHRRYQRLRAFKIGTYAVIAANRLLCKQHRGFGIKPETLMDLIQDRRQFSSLDAFGGIRGVARLLAADLDHGIPDALPELEKRRQAFGANTYVSKPRRGLLIFVWEACKDVTLIVLMVCALVSMALGIKTHGIEDGWYDGISILVAVILVVLVTSISDYRQSLQFRDLNEEKRNVRVEAVRSGRRKEVSVFDIVVGDLLLLKTGDQVPADGLFVDGHSLCLDESSMTGENEPVLVDRKMPFIVSGSKVQDGYGSMIVTAVGMRTEWGRLMATLSDDVNDETPLQARLKRLATYIGYVGTSVAALVFTILLISYFSGRHAAQDSGKFRAGITAASEVANNVLDIFVIAVTIFVVAVPEGLPLAVTLTLAYAMKKMIVDKALVRRLAACETMGNVTTICSDKTGTLTLNQMDVVSSWAAGEFAEGLSSDQLEHVGDKFRDVLLEGIVQNSRGSVCVAVVDEAPEVTGSPTERALLQCGLRLGMDYESIKSRSTLLQVEPFNSDKKMAGVAVKSHATGGPVRVHWKGAAELILENSVKVMTSGGVVDGMTPDQRSRIAHVIEAMANKSLRCVALAFKELEVDDVIIRKEFEGESQDWVLPGDSLTLLAIVGIKDPCRPEVPEAIHRCRAAGIRVKMITGDNIWTAKAIAAECGILEEGSVAIEGATFRNYSDEMRRQEAGKISVMARSSPGDKLLMVRTLRELGEVVAVTGDGTNDAPALREADIGLAMGIQGTEVAKENSDIVILDDNFATVIRVVKWGRSVYANIQKFVQFQLTVNVAALSINFVAAVTSGEVPLTAVQLLWVNLIMDTLGALALATERPTDNLLRQEPVRRTEALVSGVMWRNILVQAAFQITVLLVLQFRGESLLGLTGDDGMRVNDTIIFNAFVFCQLFNEVNARKLRDLNVWEGLARNWLFLGILGFSVIFQVIIVECLNKFASTVKLEWRFWLLSIAIGFMSWPIAFTSKLVLPITPRIFAMNAWHVSADSQSHEPSSITPNDCLVRSFSSSSLNASS